MVTLTLSRYILESSLLDYLFVGRRESLMAAASLLLAMCMNNDGVWVCLWTIHHHKIYYSNIINITRRLIKAVFICQCCSKIIVMEYYDRLTQLCLPVWKLALIVLINASWVIFLISLSGWLLSLFSTFIFFKTSTSSWDKMKIFIYSSIKSIPQAVSSSGIFSVEHLLRLCGFDPVSIQHVQHFWVYPVYIVRLTGSITNSCLNSTICASCMMMT